MTILVDYLYSLEWDIEKDAKFEISGPNGLYSPVPNKRGVRINVYSGNF